MGYNTDPIQIQQQMPLNLPDIPRKAIEYIPEPDRWHELVDLIGGTIGWVNVFWIFLAGILGLAGFLIRKKLKKLMGEQITALATWLNK